MTEFLSLRETLMRELNAGYFDLISWQACAIVARELGCFSIQAQIEKYIKHYSQEEN